MKREAAAMKKTNWTFKSHTSSIGDTGDYDSYITFTNGKDTLQTACDDLEDADLQQFCDLLDRMPDLWSHKTDGLDFELSMAKKKTAAMEKALKTIRDAKYSDGETHKEQVEDLKAIASNILHEVEKIILIA